VKNSNYVMLVILIIFGLSLSGCGKSETKSGQEVSDSSKEEKVNEPSEEIEVKNTISTLMVLENELIHEGASYDPTGIMMEDKNFNETNIPPTHADVGILSLYENNNNPHVIFASTKGYTREEPEINTYSYYLTTSKEGTWSEPIKLFEQVIEADKGLVNTDSEIFSKKPEGYHYPVASSTDGGGLYFKGNKLYIVYPDSPWDIKNFAIQMVEFKEDGSIAQNHILYEGPIIGTTQDPTDHIIPTSNGEVFVGGEIYKNEKAVYREVGEAFGEPLEIKDHYGLLDNGRILYIDFETNLAYVSDKGIKMLNIQTGEPIFENGKDKSYQIDLPMIDEVIPDEEYGYLYLVTKNAFDEKKLTVIDKELNEVSKIEVPEFNFSIKTQDSLRFYHVEEFERKPALRTFIVPTLTLKKAEASGETGQYDVNNPSSYVGVWRHYFEENDENSGGYSISLQPREGSNELFDIVIRELTPGGTFINGSESSIGLEDGKAFYEFMADANENSGMVEIELAPDGIIYKKTMYTTNPGRFNEDLEVKLTIKE
jgi:hypothetical protein